MDNFGLYLRELRGKRSLRELAKATGISHTYLSTLEKGYDPRTNKPRKPSYDTIQKLAAALGVHPYEMLEKAGLLHEGTVSALNRANTIIEMNRNGEMSKATPEEIRTLSNMQLEKAIDLRELFDPYGSSLLKYKGKLLGSKEKRKILKSIKDLLDE
ncbi:MAG TPA: helix-turn-helix transcriptional regulator [Chondromyces sp.]|nr:helix-turn-helix transcriptional regulator [Chondromyces sp.]